MKGFAVDGTGRRGAKIDFQRHGPLWFFRWLGASVAVERIETDPERRLVRFRTGKA